ncbi:hypothetical protein [Amycolatopsis sp. 195334CR]|uniref:hypothetical protein n=1 Tax=Amycolatopsis sp. 195334CR TaxID=2814588 RepID=UPI001A9079CB|nr:hypothetical protein [Amycolatopsis sp. 195334CR]MBN6037831.1 hypothetical protein [Amycolatopsis sp. 195334CR]
MTAEASLPGALNLVLTRQHETAGVDHLRIRGICRERGRFDCSCLMVDLLAAPGPWHRCGDALLAGRTPDRRSAERLARVVLAQFGGAGVVGCHHPTGMVVTSRTGESAGWCGDSPEVVAKSLAYAFSRWSSGLSLSPG